MLEKIINTLKSGAVKVGKGISYGTLLALPLLPACSNKTDSYISVPQNHPPSLEAIADLVGNENQTIKSPPLNASDPDGDPLTYTVANGPGFINADNEFEWTPTYSDSGSRPVTVAVSDGEAEASQDFNVTVNNVNRPPVLDAIADINANENDLVTITASGSDPDGDSLTFTINDPNSNFSSTNPFAWQTDYNDSGNYSVTVTADDNNGGTDSQVVQILINNVNRPPVLGTLSNIVAREGALITISPTATDPDNDPVTFTYTAPFDTSGQWQTGYYDSGTYNITVTADDNNSGTDSQVVQVNVKDNKIVFDNSSTGNSEIYLINPDGNGLTQITSTSSSNFDPNWSPDGTQIVFATYRNGNWDVYKINEDGSSQTQLTTNTSTDLRPSWSPDGTKIAFDSDRNNTTGVHDIWIINVSGSPNPTRLTTSNNNYGPNWSPNGSEIVYTGFSAGNFEIFKRNSDGSGIPTQLTTNSVNEHHPAWSPDGSKIVFERGGHIYTMNADGSSQNQITTGTSTNEKPYWSPDGICFRSNRHQSTFELYKMDSIGSNIFRLTNNTSTDDNPAWK